MHRLRLNSTLRYVGPDSRQKNANEAGVRIENGPTCQQPTWEEDSFSAEESNWLTQATMPKDTQNAIIIGESAYLIYRELVTDDGDRTFLEPVKNEEIVRLESNGGYCYVYLQDDTRYLLAMSLKWVSHYLSEFIRIHRTHAVNPIYVKQYLLDKQKKQKDRYLLLKSNQKLPWSRRHLRERRQSTPQLFDLII